MLRLILCSRPPSASYEALTIHCDAHGRSGSHSGAEGLQRRGNRDVEAGRPKQHHEKIKIRDAGFVAEQIVGLEPVSEELELARNRRARLGLFSIAALVPHRLEASMYFSRDVGQRFENARTAQRPFHSQCRVSRREPIEDGDVFRQRFAAIQHEGWNIPLTRHGGEIMPGRSPLGFEIDGFALEGCTSFLQRDVVGQAARERAVVSLF